MDRGQRTRVEILTFLEPPDSLLNSMCLFCHHAVVLFCFIVSSVCVLLFASLYCLSVPFITLLCSLLFHCLVRVSLFASLYSEAATETVFENICSFFSRSNLFIIFQEGSFVPRTDVNFPGGFICSVNRHEFSRRVYMFFEQTRIFQEGYSKRHVFSRKFYLFVEQTLISHRTHTNFPRNPYLVLEHIQIFQEPLFSHRTDTHFLGDPI